jgi:hypothetical protein
LLGLRIEPADVERVANAFREAGAPGEVAKLYAKFSRKPLNDDFGRQPISEQASQLVAARSVGAASSPRAKSAFDFFVQRGYTPVQASGIVGNLMHESDMDPTRVHDGGVGLGIAGWNGKRLAALKAFAKERGTDATDLQTQLEFVDRELRTTEGTALAALKASRTPQEAAAAFIHFERPFGYRQDNPSAAHGFANRAGLSRAAAIAHGIAPDVAEAAATPAGALWLQVNRSRELNKSAEAAWTVSMRDWDQKGVRPATAAVLQAVDAARATGNADLLERISGDMDRIELAQGQGRLPLSSQQAALGELSRASASGALAPGQAATLRDLQRRYDTISKGLNANPIATTVANFPDKTKMPAAINPADSDQFRLGLAARGRIAAFAAQNWQVPALSALDEADALAVRSALSTADAAGKVRIFADLTSALPEPIRMATFSKLGKDGGGAMVDAYAGALYAQSPEAATAVVVGWDSIKADTRFDPAANGKDFSEAFDKALPAATFGIGARTSDTGALGTMKNATRAVYAYRSALVGDTSGKLNEERLREAVHAVTGGVLRHNGGTLIAPVRGMSQGQFDGLLAGLSDDDLFGATTLGGAPITADYLRNRAKLESIGDGQYLVLLGADAGRPIYAFQNARDPFGSGPQPFVIDLRGRDGARSPSINASLSDLLRLTPAGVP